MTCCSCPQQSKQSEEWEVFVKQFDDSVSVPCPSASEWGADCTN
jgi:hypothetical protein